MTQTPNPLPATDLSVIVVSFNTREILRACLQRLFDVSEGVRLQVIVVDNASRDQSADMVAADFPEILLIRSNTNLGFAAANNLGFRQAVGQHVLLLNPDALLEPGSQLTLWRMRSQLLYYRKHHGRAVARLVAGLESGWHRLRAWRARRQGQPVKAQGSDRVVALMRQAWLETDCGLNSPPRPW